MPNAQQNFVITLGGTAQTLLPARIGRSRLIIQPTDEDLWVNFFGTAAPNVGELIYQGSTGQWSGEFFPNIGGAVSVYSATTGSNVTVREV